MPGELPEPLPLGLSASDVVAVHVREVRDERDLFRLVLSDPPGREDFEPWSRRRAARVGEVGELLRSGLSHYLSAEGADSVRRKPKSMVARVTLRHGRGIYIARTGGNPLHVTVWARPEDLVADAEVVP